MRKRIIKSVYDDQDELLAAMVGLHSGGVIECDPTYGRGFFYRYALEPPRLRFDIAPRRRGIVAADFQRLPLKDDAVASVMFDPPFFVNHTPGRKSTWLMLKRGYGLLPGRVREYRILMADVTRELYRVIAPGGILYFKCQDTVTNRGNFFYHVDICNEACSAGFRPRDLFILLAKRRPLQWNLFKQVHARKYHCYFWVFKKPQRLGAQRR